MSQTTTRSIEINVNQVVILRASIAECLAGAWFADLAEEHRGERLFRQLERMNVRFFDTVYQLEVGPGDVELLAGAVASALACDVFDDAPDRQTPVDVITFLVRQLERPYEDFSTAARGEPQATRRCGVRR